MKVSRDRCSGHRSRERCVGVRCRGVAAARGGHPCVGAQSARVSRLLLREQTASGDASGIAVAELWVQILVLLGQLAHAVARAAADTARAGARPGSAQNSPHHFRAALCGDTARGKRALALARVRDNRCTWCSPFRGVCTLLWAPQLVTPSRHFAASRSAPAAAFSCWRIRAPWGPTTCPTTTGRSGTGEAPSCTT
jgi:hypothetical protein